jgi:hypothetical protein
MIKSSDDRYIHIDDQEMEEHGLVCSPFQYPPQIQIRSLQNSHPNYF